MGASVRKMIARHGLAADQGQSGSGDSTQRFEPAGTGTTSGSLRRLSPRPWVILLSLILFSLSVIGVFWWLCVRSDQIDFLPAISGAEWVLYPSSPQILNRPATPTIAVFRRSFTLAALPARATLKVRAFKSAAVALNGQPVGGLGCTGRGWKAPRSVEVVKLLQAGTNELTAWVTNSTGPPALWLLLQTDQLRLGTDADWRVSLAEAGWQNARPASQPLATWPGCDARAPVVNSLKQVWPREVAFCAASLALLLGANRCLRFLRQPMSALLSHPRKEVGQQQGSLGGEAPRPLSAQTSHLRLQAGSSRHGLSGRLLNVTPTKLIYGLLVIVLIARAALFLNNLSYLPRPMGFDATEHEHYIQFIQENHALPLPTDGWEMYQPPLYYAGSALLLSACGFSAADERAVGLARAVNGVAGLLLCWLALLCLRLLFPGNLSAQAVGLLVVAFLPPHLYLSQYVTNELLAALFVTAAFYFWLRLLRAERQDLRLCLGLGLALGAAMLTKFSAVLALFLLPAAMGIRLLSFKPLALRVWLRTLGTVLLGCFVACGWHYARIWVKFGKPPLPNWESGSAFAWWQDPGFRTSSYYSSFGQALLHPSFSAFHSFADGIYSTLWGDGLGSGAGTDLAFRPPWNYDLMDAGYLLALGISLLVTLGLGLAVVRLIRLPRLEWFVVLGMVSLFGLGLVYLSLRAPWVAVIKAFYAFPALVPFAALAGLGFDWLQQKHRALRHVLWLLLLLWSTTIYAAFWIHSRNPATHLVRGIYLDYRQSYAEAVDCFSFALQLKPDYADAHYHLGLTLGKQGRPREAILHFQEALQFNPNCADIHHNLGAALGNAGLLEQAILHFREALRLKPDYTEASNNLDAALGRQNRPAGPPRAPPQP